MTESRSLDAGVFEDRMTSRPTDPPVTWRGWWQYDLNRETFVDGIGTLVKVSQDESVDSDSYGYGADVRTMIFRVTDCGGSRWFRVVKSSSSFDSGWYDSDADEAWEYPTVDEVFPEEVAVTRWKSV